MQDTRLPKYTPEQLEVRRKWREALRSGKYAQTNGALQDAKGYCCLGVLCDVVEPSGWTGHQRGIFTGVMGHRGNAALPKDHIQAEAGVKDPWVYALLNDDEGKSFAEIADYIEAEEAAV